MRRRLPTTPVDFGPARAPPRDLDPPFRATPARRGISSKTTTVAFVTREVALGPWGAGKSTFARALSSQTGIPYTDPEARLGSADRKPMSAGQWVRVSSDSASRPLVILDGELEKLAPALRRWAQLLAAPAGIDPVAMQQWRCSSGSRPPLRIVARRVGAGRAVAANRDRAARRPLIHQAEGRESSQLAVASAQPRSRPLSRPERPFRVNRGWPTAPIVGC